jgi:shikimate kinase
MRILLTGVSCVGKTTIARLLANRLELPFFDLDKAVENHFGASIERLQARFLTGHGYRKEASVVLKHILTENRDCVIALAPSGLRDAYLRVIRKADCVTVVLEDAPDNILQRIVFYDIDSRPIDKTHAHRNGQGALPQSNRRGYGILQKVIRTSRSARTHRRHWSARKRGEDCGTSRASGAVLKRGPIQELQSAESTAGKAVAIRRKDRASRRVWQCERECYQGGER